MLVTLPDVSATAFWLTTATAPRLMASSMKAAPSVRRPGSAKNRFPGTTRRLSIVKPEIGRSRPPLTVTMSSSVNKSCSLGAM